MRLFALMLLSCALLHSINAQAAGVLRLAHSEITLGGKGPEGKLEAENVGDSTLYLTVTQEMVQTPLTAPEVRIPVGEVSSPALLVSPQRLILGPGQKRLLEVRVLRQPQQRKIWRITFRPHENFAAQGVDEKGTRVPLSVSIGYGVVIYQQGTEQSKEPE